jgi:glyoxylase-like metal-dependent hydrolase (beta-lactamase superfamily II)
VPGHAPGHVVFIAKEEKFVVNGDCLFHGSIGRTDLPGGDHATLLESIRQQLFTLPDDFVVYCGHGPETQIGFEKQNNPFLNS